MLMLVLMLSDCLITILIAYARQSLSVSECLIMKLPVSLLNKVNVNVKL